ncbi:serine hydrolase domain-containing protein [Gemmatimonadota bacterium]
MRQHPLRILLTLLACLSACASDSSPTSQEDSYSYQYQLPEVTQDGWETASLADVGLAEAPLVRLMNDLHEMEGHRIHSVVVVRDDKLVFEEYFDGQKYNLAQPTGEYGFDRDDTHNMASVTKSITTTLVGMAIDQGYIESVQDRVFDYFPEHADLVAEDPRRGEMTIEDLLLMTSGITFNDEDIPYSSPDNDLVQMFTVDDPMRYALSRELYIAPGEVFDYCNANTNILGDIVGRATGQRLDHFAHQNLMTPLGITNYEWQMMPNQVVFASGDLRLRPRDMAKIGLLFLRMGMWEGEQVVSREWVEVATSRLVLPTGPHDWGDGYGYGWWHLDIPSGGRVHPIYTASGWGGQWITVIPEHDIVFVTTGGNFYTSTLMPGERILSDYLLPAIQ